MYQFHSIHLLSAVCECYKNTYKDSVAIEPFKTKMQIGFHVKDMQINILVSFFVI